MSNTLTQTIRLILLGTISLLFLTNTIAQDRYILKPERVFDGNSMHPGWIVIVEGEEIIYAGEEANAPLVYEATPIDLANATLMPGMIEGHSHLFLHPYNEENWNNQVLKESIAERTLRAGVHAKATLNAGFTTVRDLGSEGAGYADVGLKAAIDKGIIPGPRMMVAGRAIVATGSYGPKGFAPHVEVPLGAEEADGHDNLIKVVRNQIGNGADVIKVYADAPWGPNDEVMPTFSLDELKLIVETAKSSGRDVVAHASTEEGMRRATLAGVKTIEHGDGGTSAVYALMKQNDVALCPTLAAVESIEQYKGWKKGTGEAPDRVQKKKESFKMALDAGVKICAGGDSGVFSHGENAIELELMVEYGMAPLDALRSVTSVNAAQFGLSNQVGMIKAGMKADLVAVKGNPGANISNLKKIELVMKGGQIVK